MSRFDGQQDSVFTFSSFGCISIIKLIVSFFYFAINSISFRGKMWSVVPYTHVKDFFEPSISSNR